MLTCFKCGEPLAATAHDTETKLTQMSGCCTDGGYQVFDPDGEILKKYAAV